MRLRLWWQRVLRVGAHCALGLGLRLRFGFGFGLGLEQGKCSIQVERRPQAVHVGARFDQRRHNPRLQTH